LQRIFTSVVYEILKMGYFFKYFNTFSEFIFKKKCFLGTTEPDLFARVIKEWSTLGLINIWWCQPIVWLVQNVRQKYQDRDSRMTTSSKKNSTKNVSWGQSVTRFYQKIWSNSIG
jgi:hypothetical protein